MGCLGRRGRAIGVALGALVVAGAASVRAEVPKLDEEEFARLHRELAPIDEAWRRLPWEASILAANERAAREAKPVFMLVRSGNPLGCV